MTSVETVNGKSVATVRELVKVNHHRNCMMCHAPASNNDKLASTAAVPVPDQPFPQPSEYDQPTLLDPMIRFDVTYLRLDFSAMLPVADARPWPTLQRFDFLVRERKLTSDEAKEYTAKLTPKEPGVASPYHQVAQAALKPTNTVIKPRGE